MKKGDQPSYKLDLMRFRLKKDLEELEREPMEHEDKIKRTIVKADFAKDIAFINFIEKPKIGPYANENLYFTIIIPSEYPYQPPKIKNQNRNFLHPNLREETENIIFTYISQKSWKPTFSLNQVFFGLEMCLLNYDRLMCSLKSLQKCRGLKWIDNGEMEIEGVNGVSRGCKEMENIVEFSGGKVSFYQRKNVFDGYHEEMHSKKLKRGYREGRKDSKKEKYLRFALAE